MSLSVAATKKSPATVIAGAADVARGAGGESAARASAALADTQTWAGSPLESAADTLARRVIAKADVEESLQMLDRIGVAEKRDTGKTSVQVNVLVGECPPGLPPRAG